MKKLPKTCTKYELRKRRVPLDLREDERTYARPVDSSRRVADIARGLIGQEVVEVMIALHLDTKLRVVGHHEVGRGGLASCPVIAAEVFRTALVSGASAVIVAHNHPSGDPTPSVDDVRMTARLVEAGKIIGVNVLDHVIVTSELGYHSFADNNAI